MDSIEKVDILLVEDNPYDAELSLRALHKNRLANRVEWLQDGADALDFIFAEGKYCDLPRNPPPRLILLDIKLPRISGIEILRRLKATPDTRAIPVVMLTSSEEMADLREAYELGVNSYIVKPVDFDVFQQEVQKAGFYWMLVNQVP